MEVAVVEVVAGETFSRETSDPQNMLWVSYRPESLSHCATPLSTCAFGTFSLSGCVAINAIYNSILPLLSSTLFV